MRLDLAQQLQIGDRVYNYYMDQIIIVSKYHQMSVDKELSGIVFGTIGKDSVMTSYSHNDLYFSDLYGESDEEKSWINWATNNKDFFDIDENIIAIKTAYIKGFAAGYEHKKKLSHEEIMQK